jgi:hypothetical protein
MGVFICWSGENSRSHKIAKILRDRIPEILQTAQPFLSAVDVGAGTHWMEQLKIALKEKSFGIMCITPENRDNPWIHFEAGALWRTEEDRRVCPLLFDTRPTEITGPLSQLQCKQFDQKGFFDVMKEVNQHGASTKIDEAVLVRTFTRVWPDIEADLSKIKKPSNLVKPQRDPNDMIEEVLTIVRSFRDADLVGIRAAPRLPLGLRSARTGLLIASRVQESLRYAGTITAIRSIDENNDEIRVDFAASPSLAGGVTLVGKITDPIAAPSAGWVNKYALASLKGKTCCR